MRSNTPAGDWSPSPPGGQGEVAERLRLGGSEDRRTAGPLVLWDVGLGAAANAMAAIGCYEEQAAAHPLRGLQIVGFEDDLDSLRLAFGGDHLFPYLPPRRGGVRRPSPPASRRRLAGTVETVRSQVPDRSPRR